MSIELSKKQIREKYSLGYYKLLQENQWVQSFRKTKHSWDEFCKGIWIPPLSHLWRLIETHIPVNAENNFDYQKEISSLIRLSKENDEYVVVLEGKKKFKFSPTITKGYCFEEALLKLLILLETRRDRK